MSFKRLNRLRALFLERLAFNSFVASDFPRALYFLSKIARLCPEKRGVHYNLGLVLLALRRFAEAESCFLREQEWQGDSEPLLQALAEATYQRGDRQRALETYQRLERMQLEEKPRRLVEARLAICRDAERFLLAMTGAETFQQGCSLLDRGAHDAAELAFRQALERDQTLFMAWNNLGVIAMNIRRDLAAAGRCFRAAAELVELPLIRDNLKRLAMMEERDCP